MKSETFKKPILLITYAILLYYIITHFQSVINSVNYVLAILSPLFIGIGIAFVINLLVRFYENKLLDKLFEKKKMKKFAGLKRPLGMLGGYVTAIAIVGIIVNFIIPQIGLSVKSLTERLPWYMNEISVFFQKITSDYEFTNQLWEQFIKNIDKIISNASQVLNFALPQLLNFTKGITSGVINIFLGVVFSIYMLASKEKLINMLKKLVYAILKKEIADKVVEVAGNANVIFRSFVGGQLIEGAILGILCFAGMSIFRMPYAPLVSVIVGVFSLVPVLGAYVGVIISAFLIILESPVMALWFVLFVVILQQIEGNLIYPRVVGNAVGLSGIWVLLAVTVGGSLFGVMGILLGVPVMAVIYSLAKESVNKTLDAKNIDI